MRPADVVLHSHLRRRDVARPLIADLLNALDWRRDNAPLRDYQVRGELYVVLTNVSEPTRFSEPLRPSSTAIALARRALIST